MPASLTIQFGPQALFLLHGLSGQRRVKKIALYGAIFLNLIDAATNWGAYYQWSQTYTDVTIHPLVRQMAYVVGYIFCFAITLAEEALVLLTGVAFHLVNELHYDFFRRRLPRWLSVDAVNLTEMASGANAVGMSIPRGQQSKESTSSGSPKTGQSPKGNVPQVIMPQQQRPPHKHETQSLEDYLEQHRGDNNGH